MSKRCPLLCFAVVILTNSLNAQTAVGDSEPQLRGVPPVVHRVAKSLWLRAQMYLQTGGQSFYAVGVRAQDTSEIMKEFAPLRRVTPRTTQAVAAELRKALRQQFALETKAVGIIMDSVATTTADTTSVARSAANARYAISEIHTFDGLCVRVTTPYQLVLRNERRRMIYGDPVKASCEWQNYWAGFTDAAAKLAATRKDPVPLTAPVVKPFRFSSDTSQFSTVTRFAGTLTIYDDSIVVVFSELVIRNEASAGHGATKLQSIAVGVEGEFNGVSPIIDESEPLEFNQSWRPGQQVSRPRTRMVIHRRRTNEDAEYWLTVIVRLLAPAPMDPSQLARVSVQANSERGILAAH